MGLALVERSPPTPGLLGGGGLILDGEHLAATIGATIRAHVVRLAQLAALRTHGQLGDGDFLMRAAITLPRAGDAFLR